MKKGINIESWSWQGKPLESDCNWNLRNQAIKWLQLLPIFGHHSSPPSTSFAFWRAWKQIEDKAMESDGARSRVLPAFFFAEEVMEVRAFLVGKWMRKKKSNGMHWGCGNLSIFPLILSLSLSLHHVHVQVKWGRLFPPPLSRPSFLSLHLIAISFRSSCLFYSTFTSNPNKMMEGNEEESRARGDSFEKWLVELITGWEGALNK